MDKCRRSRCGTLDIWSSAKVVDIPKIRQNMGTRADEATLPPPHRYPNSLSLSLPPLSHSLTHSRVYTCARAYTQTHSSLRVCLSLSRWSLLCPVRSIVQRVYREPGRPNTEAYINCVRCNISSLAEKDALLLLARVNCGMTFGQKSIRT